MRRILRAMTRYGGRRTVAAASWRTWAVAMCSVAIDARRGGFARPLSLNATIVNAVKTATRGGVRDRVTGCKSQSVNGPS